MTSENTTSARIRCERAGFSLRRVYGEWQIKPLGAKWEGPHTYYASDLDDAVATAEAEAARREENRIDAWEREDIQRAIQVVEKRMAWVKDQRTHANLAATISYLRSLLVSEAK